METAFFKYLFDFLRQHKVCVNYTLPPQTVYPACECELVESQTYQERALLTFKVKSYTDGANQAKLQGYGTAIAHLLEDQMHEFPGKTMVIRLLEQSLVPPQKGSLRALHQTYQALVT